MNFLNSYFVPVFIILVLFQLLLIWIARICSLSVPFSEVLLQLDSVTQLCCKSHGSLSFRTQVI